MHIQIIRMVVTLCLVIAMMIQPMLAFGMVTAGPKGECGDPSLTCRGCGCCEIEKPADPCCCCRGADTFRSADSNRDSNDGNTSTVAPEDDRFVGTCLCGVSSFPMNNDGQRNELPRELALRDFVVQYLTVTELEPPSLRSTVVDSSPGSRADFSQRMLGVWRI